VRQEFGEAHRYVRVGQEIVISTDLTGEPTHGDSRAR
jgi:hypothetical protein